MNIALVASEMAPFIKTGGLGDVIDSLANELSKENKVYVFLPYYKSHNINIDNTTFKKSFFTYLSWRKEHVGIFKLNNKNENLNIYFIDNEHYFKRENIYGETDDCERFCYFSKAVLEAMQNLNINPQIIHCNDWQTAIIPCFLNAFYKNFFKNTKTVLTIHNIEYQGKANPNFLEDVLGLNESYLNTFLYNDCVNLLKGGILCANFVTTVSKTYAYELQYPYFAEGLSEIIKNHQFKFKGITNGINTTIYNPATDKNIFNNYTAFNFYTEKLKNKTKLQRTLNLPVNPNIPVIAMVTRLVDHKGINLVQEKLYDILNLNVQFIVLGMGNKNYEAFFCNAANNNKDKFYCNISFNNNLASKIYAASDLYLMPSKKEPCGLSQLIAMRYGSVPIVNKIGGLNDTVSAFNPNTLSGCGFNFQNFNSQDMFNAVKRAVDLYYNYPDTFKRAARNCMLKKSSFSNSCKEYLNLYKSIC